MIGKSKLDWTIRAKPTIVSRCSRRFSAMPNLKVRSREIHSSDLNVFILPIGQNSSGGNRDPQFHEGRADRIAAHDLAIHTGQRYGDLIRLRWSDYDGAHIRLKQRKTGTRVAVKATAALKAMLKSTPKCCPFILARANGRPWHTASNDKGLGKAWRERMKAAGLYHADMKEQLHLADMRGTPVALLPRPGCTVPEIVSITGHALKARIGFLEKYLARTKAISDAAIVKFETAEACNFANRLHAG